jgi:Ca2+-binding RTX toxin-like protein
VPGASGNPPVQVTLDSAASAARAGQISQSLNNSLAAGTLQTDQNTPVPVTKPDGQFIFGGSGTTLNAPSYGNGYNFVTDPTGGNTVTVGAGASLISGSTIPGGLGDTIFGSGNDTIAAGSGNNSIVVGSASGAGNSIVTGTGNDTISATGSSTVDAGLGANVVFSANSTGNLSDVLSSGQDTVVATGTGNQLLIVSGNNGLVVADQGAGGATSVDATGAGIGILGAGAGSLSVTVAGTNDTVSAGNSGPTTVVASSNAVVFGGPGTLQFIGESTGTPTVIGYGGSQENLQIGSQGAVFVDNGAGANVTSGAGQATIFGAADAVVNIFGSQAGALYVAGPGNETVNASQSTISGASGNQFWAGSDPTGNNLLVAGSGTDTLCAGAGNDTLAGGLGSDAFVFFRSQTAGTNVTTVTNFNSSDSVFLVNYGESTQQILNTANVGGSGLTLTLSDNTKVTFTGVNQVSTLWGHILSG